MNISDYTYLLNHPDAVNDKRTQELDKIVHEFPYFQSARALRLKGLYNQNSFQYNYALKVAAAYTTDRSVLFDFITSDSFTVIEKGVYDEKLENIYTIDVKGSEIVGMDATITPEEKIEQSILTSIEESSKPYVEEADYVYIESDEPSTTAEEVLTEEILPKEIQPEFLAPESTTEEVVIEEEEIHPEEIKPEEIAPEVIKPEEIDIRQEENVDETQPEESEQEETKPEEIVVDDIESEEIKVEAVEPTYEKERIEDEIPESTITHNEPAKTEETRVDEGEDIEEPEEAESPEANEAELHNEPFTVSVIPGEFEPEEIKREEIAPEVAEFSQIEIPTIEISNRTIEFVPVQQTPVLEVGKPLEFSPEEKHSFREWLQLSSMKPIVRDEEVKDNEEHVDRKKKIDLIERFIRTSPKISPVKDFKPSEQSEVYREDNSALMTETLARVYLEQKKYNKAIQAYEILILKYPEKSIFFADRISEIKKLQQNP